MISMVGCMLKGISRMERDITPGNGSAAGEAHIGIEYKDPHMFLKMIFFYF